MGNPQENSKSFKQRGGNIINNFYRNTHMSIHQIKLKLILCCLTAQLIIKLISSFKPNAAAAASMSRIPGPQNWNIHEIFCQVSPSWSCLVFQKLFF